MRHVRNGLSLFVTMIVTSGMAGGPCGCSGCPDPAVYSNDAVPLPFPKSVPTNPIGTQLAQTIVAQVVTPKGLRLLAPGGTCVVGTPITEANGSMSSTYDLTENAEAKANIEKFIAASINTKYVRSVKYNAIDVQTDTLIGSDRNSTPGACPLSHSDLETNALIILARSASGFSIAFMKSDNTTVDLSPGSEVIKAFGGNIGAGGGVVTRNTYNYTSPPGQRVFYEVYLRRPVALLAESQSHSYGLADLSSSQLPYDPYAQYYLARDPAPGSYTLHLIKPGPPIKLSHLPINDGLALHLTAYHMKRWCMGPMRLITI
jgi:hypothetical protein